MLNYTNFVEHLKEGLIRTYNITQYGNNLLFKLSRLGIHVSLDIIDKHVFNMIIDNPKLDDIEIILDECVNLFGYYPSYYYITLYNGSINEFKWNDFELKEGTSQIKIRFESKYDDGLYNNINICPLTLYHYTYTENIKNILLNGIYPKSKSRLSNHPERIYVFTDISNKSSLLNNLKRSDTKNGINKDYILLEIDCSNKSLILHTDPNYTLGYYTYDTISPNLIKVI
jgi:hypothetical protein